MEDQPTDTGDLTKDTDAPPSPQGKTARNRHRLPRQMARQTVEGDGADEAEVAEEKEEAPAPEPEVPEPEVPEAEEAPAPARRRFGWRRSKVDAAVDAPATEDVQAEDAQPDAEVAADDLDAIPAGPEPVLVPHRPVGRALVVAAVVAGAVFVGAAAFAGAAAQPYLADRALATEKFEVAQTAASAISTLWTYAPDNIDTLPDRASKYLTGDFANQYRQFIDSIVEANKQAQVTNETQVVGAAVESLTPTEATAIVYTNSVANSPGMKGIPALRYLSYRLTLVPRGGHWLISRMVAVTSLDLSPKI